MGSLFFMLMEKLFCLVAVMRRNTVRSGFFCLLLLGELVLVLLSG